MSDDPNIAAERLSAKINNILNKHAPVRKIQTRNHFAPWLSEETKEVMSHRNKLHNAAIESQDKDDWACYNQLRNKVNRKVKEEKVEWQQRKLVHCEGDPN